MTIRLGLAVVIAISALLALAPAAEAGKRHFKGVKSGHHSIRLKASGRRTGLSAFHAGKRRHTAQSWHGVRHRHAGRSGSVRHPAAASGVMLGHDVSGRRVHAGVDHHRRHGGPKILRYDRKRHRWHHHDVGSGGLVVVVGRADDTKATSGKIVLEGGSCAAGEYCSVRLGRYSSSPKVITLNETGKAITEAGFE